MWAHDAPASLGTPASASLPSRAPFVVIGAGICGAWCALEIARRGEPVVLVDARTPGDGATGRNAGFLLAESECFGLAAAAHGESVAIALREAGLRTRELVRDVVAARTRSVQLRWPGSVRLAEDDGEHDAFVDSAAALDDVATLAPARVREAGHAERYIAALRDDGDGVVHPLRLLGLVLDEARAAGAAVHTDTPVIGLDPTRGGVRVCTPHGDIRAGQVIVAASAASRRVLRATRPIRPVRAQALAARVDPDPGWKRPVYATRGGDYWRPLGRGRVLVGGLRRLRRRHENTAAELPSRELQRSLKALLRRLVGPDAEIAVTHRWAGTMAFTPDGLPWVGRVPRTRRVSVISGMNGHGMGWAPAFAETLVAHLVESAPPPPSFLRPRP